MATTITVGYDRRCWATFTVADATPEEIETLSYDTTEAMELVIALEKSGRLSYESEDQDECPEYFDPKTSSVVEIEEV